MVRKQGEACIFCATEPCRCISAKTTPRKKLPQSTQARKTESVAVPRQRVGLSSPAKRPTTDGDNPATASECMSKAMSILREYFPRLEIISEIPGSSESLSGQIANWRARRMQCLTAQPRPGH